MKKLVRESIGFERGGDPRRSMRVGKLESLKKKYGEEELDELLFSASLEGNLEDVKFLLEQGANLHSYYDFTMRMIKHFGHHDVFNYLKSKMADEYRNIMGR